MSTTPSLRSRVHGCLLGGTIGDALGAPVEFLSLPQIRGQFGMEGVTEFEEAYGRRGAITDDTQMTLFTAEGLLRAQNRMREKGICHPPSVVHGAYLRWLETQGGRSEHSLFGAYGNRGLIADERLHKRRAPGKTCISALRGDTMGTPSVQLNDSKGCGGVMRVAPVGLLAIPGRAFALGCETAALTHSHPTGYLAAGGLALLIAKIMEGRSLDEALDRVEERLAEEDDHEETLTEVRRARELAASGEEPTPEAVETLGAGWVAEEALGIGLYCALAYSTDFRRGVLLAVNHSGDTDSTGAIAGNILGALLGVEAIPEAWREEVELADLVRRVGDDVAEAAAGGEISWEQYPGW